MTIVLTQQCYYQKKALYSRLVAQDDRSSGKLTLLLLFFLCKVVFGSQNSTRYLSYPEMIISGKFWVFSYPNNYLEILVTLHYYLSTLL